MTRRDRWTVAALAAILAVVALLVALPPGSPPASSTAAPSEAAGASASTPGTTVYREGVLSTWTSLTPISAETSADRQIVALVFAGLVRLGPDGELLPDVAASWTVDPSGGTYTFSLRPDATWQDGTPVTADDVAFTFHTLQDPGYTGPLGSSWQEVTVTALDQRTVRFKLATPLGGFLQALTQPLLPEHLLRGLTPSDIAMSSFAASPVGNGPYRVVSIDRAAAILERVAPAEAAVGEATAGTSGDASTGSAGALVASASAAATDGTTGSAPPSAAPTVAPTAGPTTASGRPIDRIELHFYDTDADLAAAVADGSVDAAVGLSPGSIATLAASAGIRVYRYPTATLTAVVPNERGQSAFKNALVRKALSVSLDRDRLVATVLSGDATRADGLVPPSSWAYSATATPRIAYDRTAATSALRSAGWTRGGGSWIPKGSKKPLTLQLVAPDATTNTMTYAAAGAVAAAWRSIGFKVTLTGLGRDELARRLQTGTYMLAVVSVNLGLDPDLYPFLGSTQARTSGSNIAGVQSLVLDGLLQAARKPGSLSDRRKAYVKVQRFLSTSGVVFPLWYANLSIVATDRLSGPTTREVASPGDRYWDVLTWRLADGR